MGKGEEEDGNAPLNVSVNLKPLYKKKKKEYDNNSNNNNKE